MIVNYCVKKKSVDYMEKLWYIKIYLQKVGLFFCTEKMIRIVFFVKYLWFI